jgi:predicted Rossmann-fold nucleotide-binding protein
MAPDAHPVLGIFVSDQGRGDAERATIMSQAGSYLARKGARLACVIDRHDDIPVPLLTSARTAGAAVTLIADEQFSEPSYLSGVTVEHLATPQERLARLAALSTLYIALPGSLSSAISLYRTWVQGGGGAGRKPVVFLDRNGAFKVVRGYAADVLSTSIRNHDRYVQFADSVEDLWNRAVWLIDQGATNPV